MGRIVHGGMIVPIVAQTPPPGVDLDTIIGSLGPLILGFTALIVTGAVLYRFFTSEMGSAIAERIRAGGKRRKAMMGPPSESAVDERRVAQLEEQVGALHGQLAELAERLDFAERLLAQKRGERALPAGE
jgi:uncharacterized protein involved in exopolysaccharide biosynthesis